MKYICFYKKGDRINETIDWYKPKDEVIGLKLSSDVILFQNEAGRMLFVYRKNNHFKVQGSKYPNNIRLFDVYKYYNIIPRIELVEALLNDHEVALAMRHEIE